ncbi:MAG: lipase [Nostoc sp.]|uniref:lipase family protein n=1 Tax=Nostoc sp. TaxID=1180 RepID=UPI002FF5803E
MRLRRRQILLAGLTLGIVATISRNYQRLRAHSKLMALAQKESQTNLHELLKQTFEADAKKINKGIEIQASLKLTPSNISYDRSVSKLLIQCSKLGTQQYLSGKVNPSFDGSIKSLPAYTSHLDGYTQIASLKGLEDVQSSETIQVDVPVTNHSLTATQDPVENNLDAAQTAIGQTVKQAVKLKQLIPVYFGFVLISKTANIIIFRGTQRTTEWIGDILLFQKNYDGFANSKIHSGFAKIYKDLAGQTREIANHLNPSLPCYISGHSLGAALATLAAVDLALSVPKLKKQIRLYTYAGPRVGNPSFAQMHSQLVPNSYRIFNLADSIPLSPPTIFRKDVYSHVGEAWSFLTQHGDVLPNHAVDTYRTAVNREVETNKARTYPTSG